MMCVMPADAPIEAAARDHAAFIWSVADLLRGDYKQSEYGKVVLPLTVLRRLDCVLEKTKPDVVRRHAELQGRIENVEPVLQAPEAVKEGVEAVFAIPLQLGDESYGAFDWWAEGTDRPVRMWVGCSVSTPGWSADGSPCRRASYALD